MNTGEINNPILEEALRYRRRGWSVIPVGSDKKPLIKWERFQTELAGEEEIRSWFLLFPNANIGIVTGSISGIVVVDVEKGGRTDDLPPTVISKSGGGGFHYYYKHPGVPVKNGVRIGKKEDLRDIRGDSGYIVAPPSRHKSGNSYEWIVPPEDTLLTDFPQWLIKQERTSDVSPKDGERNWQEKVNGVSEGERNSTAAAISGKLLMHLPEKDWEGYVWPLLRGWNNGNNPPLPDMELRSVFDSIAQRQAQKGGGNGLQIVLPKILSWREFGKHEFPWANQWRIKGLIPVSARCIIAAPSGEGKSWLAMAMAMSVAAGTPYLGNPEFVTTQCKVLYIENETAKSDFQRRGKRLGFHEVEDNLFAPLDDWPPLNNKKTAEDLYELVKAQGIGLVIIDTFRSVSGGIKEEKAEEIRGIFDNFKPFIEIGITVVILDHCRKPHPNEGGFIPKKEQLLGSQDKFAAVEAVIMLRTKIMNRTEGGETANVYTYPMKNKSGATVRPFQIDIVHVDDPDGGGTTVLTYAGKIEESALQAAVAQDAIMDYLAAQTEPRTSSQIIETLRDKAGKSVIEMTLKKLREDKKVEFKKQGRPYVYWLAKEDAGGGELFPSLDI
jgi:hypothetical protein